MCCVLCMYVQVTIQPDPKDLVEPLEFPREEVRKYFRVGDHIKVESGPSVQETGLIVRILEAGSAEAARAAAAAAANGGGAGLDDEDLAVVFSDVSQSELTVRLQDIAESTEVSAGKDSLGEYQLFDMVHLK
jgi:transcription elongation factor SPT5